MGRGSYTAQKKTFLIAYFFLYHGPSLWTFKKSNWVHVFYDLLFYRTLLLVLPLLWHTRKWQPYTSSLFKYLFAALFECIILHYFRCIFLRWMILSLVLMDIGNHLHYMNVFLPFFHIFTSNLCFPKILKTIWKDLL